MPLDTRAVGREYAPATYVVAREKVREFAAAVGETDRIYFDVDAARAAGHADVVAPPMFCVVYAKGAVAPAAADPEVGMNAAMVVHGAQEFNWGELVVAGDEITTSARVADIYGRGGHGFYVFESTSMNQRGERVCDAVWTNIVRGG